MYLKMVAEFLDKQTKKEYFGKGMNNLGGGGERGVGSSLTGSDDNGDRNSIVTYKANVFHNKMY